MRYCRKVKSDTVCVCGQVWRRLDLFEHYEISRYGDSHQAWAEKLGMPDAADLPRPDAARGKGGGRN